MAFARPRRSRGRTAEASRSRGLGVGHRGPPIAQADPSQPSAAQGLALFGIQPQRLLEVEQGQPGCVGEIVGPAAQVQQPAPRGRSRTGRELERPVEVGDRRGEFPPPLAGQAADLEDLGRGLAAGDDRRWPRRAPRRTASAPSGPRSARDGPRRHRGGSPGPRRRRPAPPAACPPAKKSLARSTWSRTLRALSGSWRIASSRSRMAALRWSGVMSLR